MTALKTVYYSNIKMMEISISDKWKYGALPGLLIHSCLGTIYCWSLITEPVKEAMGGVSCEWAFSLAMFFLGLTAAFIGPIIDRNVKLSLLISSVCFGTGMILSGIACATSNPVLFHVGYGIIMGIGLGIGYVGPIRTLLLWFHDRKGLAAGIAVAGFGLAKILGGPGFSYFIKHFGITETLVFHGFLYLLIMLLSVIFIKRPDDIPEKKTSISSWISDLGSTIRLPNIWNYWLIFFLSTSAGLAIISSEAAFFRYSGITAFGIGFAVSLCAITNTFGRIFGGWISDFVKNKGNILGIITVISILSCLMGFSSPKMVSWLVLVCNAEYGAMFAILPGVLANKYGVNNVSKTLGMVLSSWALSGLFGNQLAQLAMWLPISYSPRIIIICATILYLIAVYHCAKIWENRNKE